MEQRQHRGHNEGSIRERTYKSGKKVYEAFVSLPGGGRRSQTCQTEREAKRWLREAQVDAARGRLAAKRPPTLAAYLADTWLPSIESEVKSRTHVSYELAARRVPDWLGAMRLDDLKPAHFQRFYKELTDAKKAPLTVRQTHKALEDALPLDFVIRNPTDGASLPRVPQADVPWYTDDELAQLFEATAGDRFHALWLILGTLGLRLGEALGLKWSDVDWQAGTIRVIRKLERDRKTGELHLSEMKTKHSRRTLPLGTLGRDALQAHQGRQKFEKKKGGEAWQERGLIFSTIYGGYLDQGRIHEHWTPAVKKAGLPRHKPHALRHSVASNLVRSGCDVFRVAQLLGHRNANMVIQVYGHLRPDDHHQAAAMMESLVTRHRKPSQIRA